MFTQRYSEAELSNRFFRRAILPKWEVYYILLANGRCFGYRRTPKCRGQWVARVTVNIGATVNSVIRYRERVIGLADDDTEADGNRTLTFAQGKQRALDWIDGPEIRPIRREAFPLRRTTGLLICPIGTEYTVGHAMRDYCNWKLTSAQSSPLEGSSLAQIPTRSLILDQCCVPS